MVGAAASGRLLWSAASSRKFTLPAPDPAGSKPNPPKMIPQPAGATLHVPQGFRTELYAKGLDKPRCMVQLPSGEVLVTEATAKGAVAMLSSAGSEKRVVISGLDRPFGMALFDGYLYVAEAEAIKRYKLDGKSMPSASGEVVVPLQGYGKGHWTRSIAFDTKAKKMYVSVGSGSNVDPGDPADRAAINVYNPDGSGHAVIAGGLRNPVSIRFHPVSRKLWATVQERDGLGDELVPDFFTEVRKGAFYGWPYAYIGSNEEPRLKGQKPELVKKAIEPDVLLGPHVAVMDCAFYTGSQFPARYKNGAFLAYRGSSGRTKRTGYSVHFVPFSGGKPSGPPEEFASGWMLGEDVKEVWGRPVGLVQLNDGSLLVSEDGNNTVWRISYGG
jgi:glucose/arabinose dehydrogenase